MIYSEVLTNLKQSINQKGLTQVFADSIKTLKYGFGEEVSTKFLRSLSNLNDNRKKTRRINYLIKNSGFSTTRTLNFYDVRGVNGHKVEVVDWGHDKKTQVFLTAELTDNEKRQIAELKQIQKEAGISLFNHAEADFKDRQATTNAFNIGGGAVVRDVRVVGVGAFEVEHRSEVLFMVN